VQLSGTVPGGTVPMHCPVRRVAAREKSWAVKLKKPRALPEVPDQVTKLGGSVVNHGWRGGPWLHTCAACASALSVSFEEKGSRNENCCHGDGTEPG